MPSGEVVDSNQTVKESTEEVAHQEYVVQLRELVNADQKFQNFRKDDSYLLRFLHATDFDIELSYKRYNDYFDLISEYQEYFATGSPLQFKSFIDQNTRFILPDARDNDGRRIMVSLLGNIDTTTMSVYESAQLDEYWLELILDEPQTQRAGLSVIMDLKDFSWGIFRWLTLSHIKFGNRKADLLPCKELVYHVVNSSVFLNAAMKLVFPLLSNKVKEKFHFHFNNWESLHQHIDAKYLPPHYGGTGPEWDVPKINQWLYDNDSKVGSNLQYQLIKKD